MANGKARGEKFMASLAPKQRMMAGILIISHSGVPPFLLRFLVLRASIYFSTVTRSTVEALHEKKSSEKKWIQVLSWSEASMPNTMS